MDSKREFWNTWHDNMKNTRRKNNRFYIQKYYNQILPKVNIEELLEGEKNPILICYEKGKQFCHRHILAEYIELKYGIQVRDIKIDENLNIEENQRPEYIRNILKELIEQELKR